MSHRSYRSLSQRSLSSSSSMGSILRQMEAKLQAHRIMVEHLDEELELEAKLRRFRAQKELRIAECELSVLKEQHELGSCMSSRSRTEEYLELLPKYEQERKMHETSFREKAQANPPTIDKTQSEINQTATVLTPSCPPNDCDLVDPQLSPFQQNENIRAATVVTPSRPIDPCNSLEPKLIPIPDEELKDHGLGSQLDPTVQPFTPRDHGIPQQCQIIDVFMKHLVKRDLILSRLSKFDDNPMMYVSWKAGFQNIMMELGATDTEQLELLCEKLGPTSSTQAKTIKACNANSPKVAIDKIWERLDRRFGAAEQVEAYILKKIKEFPEITADCFHLLYDLADLASEIASLKAQPQYRVLFSYFDSKRGVNELVEKLPWNLKDKWTSEATRYKQSSGAMYPPFPIFLKFLENMAEMKNDPAFQFEKRVVKKQPTLPSQQPRQAISKLPANKTSPWTMVAARKTETIPSSTKADACPLHKNSLHSLNDCKHFRQMSVGERKKIILTNGICFKCCSGEKHQAKNCRAEVKCNVCCASSHPTALHDESTGEQKSRVTATKAKEGDLHEGERRPTISSACTKVHGTSKSCAKIIPVRVSTIEEPHKSMLAYAIIDDQSNRSLGTSSLFNYFQDSSSDVPYTLVSCTGAVTATGRFGTGYTVESLDGTCKLNLPELVECNDLPSNRDEIPSRQVAEQCPHLAHIASEIPEIIESANIELLIGRDLTSAHIVNQQIVGNGDDPFAQRLSLGWVIVGQVCLGGVHIPEVRTFKTYVLKNGRPSMFEPCDNQFFIHDTHDLFQRTDHDEKIGLSVEDREFLELMNTSFERDDSGHWVAPLPFKRNHQPLPNNKTQALQRARSFDKNL